MQEMAKNTSTTASSELQAEKCSLCHDTGYIQVTTGSLYTAVKECDCMKARKAEALMQKSGLAHLLKELTFDAFEVTNDIQREMKDTALRYVETLSTMPADAPKKPWFYIGGNPGCGKTHICTAMCGELLKRNIGIVYMKWAEESRWLRAHTMETDYDGRYERYIDADVLYVDDFFKQPYHGTPIIGDAEQNLSFRVLDARYSMNRPTIISSEWDLLEHILPTEQGTYSRVYQVSKDFTISIPRDVKYNYRLSRAKGA